MSRSHFGSSDLKVYFISLQNKSLLISSISLDKVKGHIQALWLQII